MLQTIVKKWFRDKNSGYLDNGNGPDIPVSRSDLVNCEYLKVGATVEFECQIDKQGLIAKKVKLVQQNRPNGLNNRGKRIVKEFRPGVMT
jgi:cold shock CspA family protein